GDGVLVAVDLLERLRGRPQEVVACAGQVEPFQLALLDCIQKMDVGAVLAAGQLALLTGESPGVPFRGEVPARVLFRGPGVLAGVVLPIIVHRTPRRLEIVLVLVPGLFGRAEIRAEQPDEGVVPTLPLRLGAGVLPERRAMHPPGAVDQKVDERPRGAVGQDGPVAAPQGIAPPRGEQRPQRDGLAVPYPLYILPQGRAGIELDPDRPRDDRAGAADVPRLDVQPGPDLREAEVGRESLLEPLRRLAPRRVDP